MLTEIWTHVLVNRNLAKEQKKKKVKAGALRGFVVVIS